MRSKLDIIIVNWNSGAQLRNCMTSISSTVNDSFDLKRVVVVDNNSHDDSLDRIETHHLPIKVIINKNNRGFSAACNQGASGSTADYLLFLNPDTILKENSISDSIAFMDNPTNDRIGIVGIQLVDEDSNVSRTCARFPTPSMFVTKMLGLDKISCRLFPSYLMNDWDHEENRHVDHVIGAFFFLRRSLFESLNGFDESYFVYLEDLDFSLRAYNAGWKSYYLADVKAFHKGGGVSEQAKASRLYYSLRSRIIYANKHMSSLISSLIILGVLLLEPWIRLFYSTLKMDVKQFMETVVGYALLWGSLPRMVTRGKKH